MDYQELKQLEDDLWEAADQLRANSKLTANEYSMPVLGLIFLRHATTRFNALLPDVEKDIPARATGALREERIKLGFQGKAAIYLPETSRYDYLAALPAGTNVGEAIRDAMIAIEDSVTDQNGNKLLAGALPKDYLGLERDLLAELVKIFNSPVLAQAKGDVFGRIYEYFLNQFAQSGAQEGGEFFTPPSLVRMIVNIIEPGHGTVLDPACGSAGMFVQTGHFIEDVCHQNTHDIDITFYGQEKADLNSKLARMNLAVHGLEGKIRIGNTFYEDHHQLVGLCDFVMANPPFNVDGVQVAKIKSQVGENQTGRLPFGLPGITGKSKGKNGGEGENISNANSLWIQYFYSYLNTNGRAGFVMASSASDAGNKDRDIRQKLVETGHVDVMMSIGPKFFYTRSLPCTLWFYDKGKPADLLNTVLMIDARNVYTVVSARSHVFTDEQLANLNAVAWLYRGEQHKFVELLARYQHQVGQKLATLPERLSADQQMV
ncbi:MAG: class I SAM-dependent DNA methyltransferase, partial [Methylophilaceae bacterium]|nr:class I SAM-dependent DNA methyltransferase [Methylophilaceae bacterium]